MAEARSGTNRRHFDQKIIEAQRFSETEPSKLTDSSHSALQ
jgi:hypothetical protein